MPFFRSKPKTVEAIQLNWSNWNDICDFVGNVISVKTPARHITENEVSDTCGEIGPIFIEFDVTTTHGEIAVVRHGDWIIRDSKPGTFYPCKPDVFKRSYEEIKE